MRYNARFFVPGLSVHIIRRGINRETIFRDDRDYLVFLRILSDAAAKFGLAVHGFVLMTTHYHALATPGDDVALPHAMKEVGERYVRYFNSKYERIGTAWTGRYRAIPVDSAMYWLTCLRYIEQNPVRSKMVRSPEEYAWSSYRANALGESIDWLVEHPVMRELGDTADERRSAYRLLCRTSLTNGELVDQELTTQWTGRASIGGQQRVQTLVSPGA